MHTTVPSSSATSPHVVSFRSLPDLACSNVGGKALSCSDDFFASMDNLIKPEAPVFIVGKFTTNGKWMDGWESRRKRVSGYDWCVLRLGTPGAIVGCTVDTSFFVGNFPESCSIEACSIKYDNEQQEMETLNQTQWTELISQSPLSGGTANYFSIPSYDNRNPIRFTHVRFNIFPDGGVARLKVHGHVMPDWNAAIASSQARTITIADANADAVEGLPIELQAGLVDVACVVNGANVITSNDAFFGAHSNLILPHRAENMGDGWETRRKRILPGHDWIIVQLGTPAKIDTIEIDTNHFKGNFPDSTSIEGLYLDPSLKLQPMDFHRPHDSFQYFDLLQQTKLKASCRHFYSMNRGQLMNGDKVVTHIRMKIFPDGGISRLRMWGKPVLA